MKQFVTLLLSLVSLVSTAQNVGIGTTTPQTKLSVNGDFSLMSAPLTIADGIHYALDVNSNKFSNYRLSGPSSNFVIAGITAGADGRLITINNRSGHSLVFYNEDPNAVASDRIVTATGGSLDIYNGGAAVLQYDGSQNRWVVQTTHYSSLDYYGGGSSNFWNAAGSNIINANVGNVGIGVVDATRAKLEINGVAGTGNTSLLVGGEGNGLSFQRNWPTIGFNQYRDDPAGYGKAIADGYGAQLYLDPTKGDIVLAMNDSIGAGGNFPAHRVALAVHKKGNLGIRTFSPDASLSVGGGDNFPSHFNFGSDGHTYIRGGNRNYRPAVGITPASYPSHVYINDVPGQHYLTGAYYPGGNVYMANGGGSVGIGTLDLDGYRLAVNGSIRSKEVVVETGWADYVFDKSYRLKSLSEVESFINQHHHLPGIPAASDIKKNGLPLGDLQKKMMEKIEELTLYIIEQEKKIKSMEAKISKLELQ